LINAVRINNKVDNMLGLGYKTVKSV